MPRETWDRETLLDVIVNVVPIGILLVFIALFMVVTPWGLDLTPASLVQFGLAVSMIVLLVYVTYLTAERI
jgi:hypothetical protein